MTCPSRYAALLAVAGVSLLSPATGMAEIAITHSGVQCVVAERFPRFEAQVPAGVELVRARIHFRPESSAAWYSVGMARTGDALTGSLPRPRKSLPSFRYYIEVTDAAFASSRTAEFAPIVADSRAGCSDMIQAATETTAAVLLMSPSGAPSIPAGFASTGVTTTAAGGAAGAAVSGGGGVGATMAIVGGVVVAGGAALAVAGRGGDGGSGENDGDGNGGGPGGSPGNTPGGSPGVGVGGNPVRYSVLFEPSPPGIDVSACAGSRVTWSSQSVNVRPDGTFDETWAPSQPNTMRVTGRATATTFEATLACVSGGPSGTITATGSTDLYLGSFDFRGSRGTARVERR